MFADGEPLFAKLVTNPARRVCPGQRSDSVTEHTNHQSRVIPRGNGERVGRISHESFQLGFIVRKRYRAGLIGQYLRESDRLKGIKSLVAIPGAICEFDLPSYRRWLHRPALFRLGALEGWLKLMPHLRDAATIVLRLLRSSGRPKNYTATNS